MEDKYNCKLCRFNTNILYNFDKHMETKKHKKNVEENAVNSETISLCNDEGECDTCKKRYKSKSGLWKHKQKCGKGTATDNKLVEIVNTLITQHNEFRNFMIERPPAITNITNNNFNINIFLNEECKDAMNIKDFVKEIAFEYSNYENIDKLGYVANKTGLIMDQLNKLSLNRRPLHYYIKNDNEKSIHVRDDDKWKLETPENKPILEGAIKELNDKEYQDFFKVSFKKSNGDVNNLKNFSKIRDKITNAYTEGNIHETITDNILETVTL